MAEQGSTLQVVLEGLAYMPEMTEDELAALLASIQPRQVNRNTALENRPQVEIDDTPTHKGVMRMMTESSLSRYRPDWSSFDELQTKVDGR